MNEMSPELKNAKLCLNCDHLFWGKQCPICAGGQDSWVWLSRWSAPKDIPEIVEGERNA